MTIAFRVMLVSALCSDKPMRDYAVYLKKNSKHGRRGINENMGKGVAIYECVPGGTGMGQPIRHPQ